VKINNPLTLSFEFENKGKRAVMVEILRKLAAT
jgi:hypothetical protein